MHWFDLYLFDDGLNYSASFRVLVDKRNIQDQTRRRKCISDEGLDLGLLVFALISYGG